MEVGCGWGRGGVRFVPMLRLPQSYMFNAPLTLTQRTPRHSLFTTNSAAAAAKTTIAAVAAPIGNYHDEHKREETTLLITTSLPTPLSTTFSFGLLVPRFDANSPPTLGSGE